MIQIIAMSLMSRLPEWEKVERLKFAEDILGDIECEGMLPPAIIPPGKNNIFDSEFMWEYEDV